MGYRVKEIFYTLQGEGFHSGRAAVFCRLAGCNLWSGREEDRETAPCGFCDTDFVGTDGSGGGEFGSAEELAEAVAGAWAAGSGSARCDSLSNECGTEVARISRSACGLRSEEEQIGDCADPLHKSDDEADGSRTWRSTPLAGSRTWRSAPLVVVTGGEPLLQLDAALVDALHGAGFEVAIETNGTLAVPAGVDWVCVSPKAGCALKVREGDELKLVFPQEGVDPAEFEGLAFRHFFLQPRDGGGSPSGDIARDGGDSPGADKARDGGERERNTRLAVAYCLEHPQWHLSVQLHKFLGIR